MKSKDEIGIRRAISRRALLAFGAAAAAVPLLSPFTAAAQSIPNSSSQEQGAEIMEYYVTTKDGTQIFYKDWGPKNAQPIVFHHGWPLSADDWDTQMLFFLANGYRVVAHDRRGHGRSSQSATGHDMDHYASDASGVWNIST